MLQTIEPDKTVPAISRVIVDQLIHQAHAGDARAQRKLREFLAGGASWYLSRSLNSVERDGQLPQLLNLAMEAVMSGRAVTAAELASSMRLSALAVIEQGGSRSRNIGPVEVQPGESGVRAVKQALSEVLPRDREALLRFYEGQSSSRVCAELQVSPTDFAALKKRIQVRCEALRSASRWSSLGRAAAGFILPRAV